MALVASRRTFPPPQTTWRDTSPVKPTSHLTRCITGRTPPLTNPVSLTVTTCKDRAAKTVFHDLAFINSTALQLWLRGPVQIHIALICLGMVLDAGLKFGLSTKDHCEVPRVTSKPQPRSWKYISHLRNARHVNFASERIDARSDRQQNLCSRSSCQSSAETPSTVVVMLSLSSGSRLDVKLLAQRHPISHKNPIGVVYYTQSPPSVFPAPS